MTHFQHKLIGSPRRPVWAYSTARRSGASVLAMPILPPVGETHTMTKSLARKNPRPDQLFFRAMNEGKPDRRPPRGSGLVGAIKRKKIKNKKHSVRSHVCQRDEVGAADKLGTRDGGGTKRTRDRKTVKEG